MDLFYVTQPVDVSVGYYNRGHVPSNDFCPYAFRSSVVADPLASTPWTEADDLYRLQFSPAALGKLDTSCIYFACHPRFFKGLMAFEQRAQTPDGQPLVRLLTRSAEAELFGSEDMPLRLDFCNRRDVPFVRLENQLSALGARDSVRIAVINSFNGAFGDTLVHLCVLQQARRILEAAFDAVRIDLFQHRCNPETEKLYLRSRLIQHIGYLPAPAIQLQNYDAFFDVGRAYIGDEHLVDSALRMFSIDPNSVLAKEKRMWLPPLSASVSRLDRLISDARKRGRRLLLFHPLASVQMRSCAAPHAARLVREIVDRSDFVVASAVPIDVDHPRYVNWSLASRTFSDFTYLIARSDAIVSVDTCTYHIADAYNVPGVVLFTTIAPEHRTRDYPRIEGIAIQPTSDFEPGLDDLAWGDQEAYLDLVWQQVNADQLLAALDCVMTNTEARHV